MAESVQFRVEDILLVPSEAVVEVLGFLVVILVDAHLTGVGSHVEFSGAVVRISVSWGEGFDVNESSFGAGKGLVFGVDVLGDDVGNDPTSSKPLGYDDVTYMGENCHKYNVIILYFNFLL